MKNQIWIFSGILVMAPFVFAQSANLKEFVYWTPQRAQWMEDRDAPGTYGKNVTGGASTGNWVMYVKVNPGAWINWHWHSNPQTLYVVSGTMNYEVKPQPRLKLTPGSYLVIPGHALHNGTCVSKQACTFFIENLLPNDKHMTDANGNELNRR